MGWFFGASLILGHFVKSGVGPILEFGLTLAQQCLLGLSNKKSQTTHDDIDLGWDNFPTKKSAKMRHYALPWHLMRHVTPWIKRGNLMMISLMMILMSRIIGNMRCFKPMKKKKCIYSRFASLSSWPDYWNEFELQIQTLLPSFHARSDYTKQIPSFIMHY